MNLLRLAEHERRLLAERHRRRQPLQAGGFGRGGVPEADLRGLPAKRHRHLAAEDRILRGNVHLAPGSTWCRRRLPTASMESWRLSSTSVVAAGFFQSRSSVAVPASVFRLKSMARSKREMRDHHHIGFGVGVFVADWAHGTGLHGRRCRRRDVGRRAAGAGGGQRTKEPDPNYLASLAAEASRPAALLIACILPVCALFAPCRIGRLGTQTWPTGRRVCDVVRIGRLRLASCSVFSAGDPGHYAVLRGWIDSNAWPSGPVSRRHNSHANTNPMRLRSANVHSIGT